MELASVRAVITGGDAHGIRIGRRLQDWPVLAWDRVRFIGQPVAMVIAETLNEAKDAAELIPSGASSAAQNFSSIAPTAMNRPSAQA